MGIFKVFSSFYSPWGNLHNSYLTEPITSMEAHMKIREKHVMWYNRPGLKSYKSFSKTPCIYLKTKKWNKFFFLF